MTFAGKTELAVAVAVALLAAACGDDGGGSADSGAAADATTGGEGGGTVADAATAGDAAGNDGGAAAHDIITEDCAPNDGPALRLLIADAVGPSCRAIGTGATLEISVWVGDVSAPETLDIGQATLCPGGLAPCALATGGTVTFDTFSAGVGATGAYSLAFPGGTETGSFAVSWCTPADPIVCG